MFSCEFSEISKNIFFTEHLQTTASAFSFSEAATGGVLWKKRCSWKFHKTYRKTPTVCKIFKNIFLTEHLWTTHSGTYITVTHYGWGRREILQLYTSERAPNTHLKAKWIVKKIAMIIWSFIKRTYLFLAFAAM